MWWRCCQTNWLKHHKLGGRGFYGAIRERHLLSAASPFSLVVPKSTKKFDI